MVRCGGKMAQGLEEAGVAALGFQHHRLHLIRHLAPVFRRQLRVAPDDHLRLAARGSTTELIEQGKAVQARLEEIEDDDRGRAIERETEGGLAPYRERLRSDDGSLVERLNLALSRHHASMFRQPEFFATLRQKVVPILRTARVTPASCQ